MQVVSIISHFCRYERKEWLATLPAPHSSAQALVDAICRFVQIIYVEYAGIFKETGDEVPLLNFLYPRCDIAEVSLALAHSSLEEVVNHNS